MTCARADSSQHSDSSSLQKLNVSIVLNFVSAIYLYRALNNWTRNGVAFRRQERGRASSTCTSYKEEDLLCLSRYKGRFINV